MHRNDGNHGLPKPTTPKTGI